MQLACRLVAEDGAKVVSVGRRAASRLRPEIDWRQGDAAKLPFDDLVRIEIKGSTLAGLVDETSYQKVPKAARQELRNFCDAQGRVSLRVDATIVAAGKRFLGRPHLKGLRPRLAALEIAP